MVYIDTDGLRGLSAALGRLSEALIPIPGPPSLACGFPELIASCTAFDRAREQAQLMTAREVEALAVQSGAAAHSWERAEAALGRR